MTEREWQRGDVVQIDPAHDEMFGGCLMTVTEPKSWGAQGYVKIPGSGMAYYRAPHRALEYVGRAVWAQPDAIEGGDDATD